jgi:chromosome segregation ATPase
MSDHKESLTFDKLVTAYKSLKSKYNSLKRKLHMKDSKCSQLEFDLDKKTREVELLRHSLKECEEKLVRASHTTLKTPQRHSPKILSHRSGRSNRSNRSNAETINMIASVV